MQLMLSWIDISNCADLNSLLYISSFDSENFMQMSEGGVREDTEIPVKVSVVVAVFNGEQYLEQTLNSIIEQTYQNIELIVVDGASTDRTHQILQKFNDKIDYWISEPDNGIYDAWNKAIKASSGEWISFVGADDILLPTAIEQYLQHIESLKPQTVEYVSSKIQIVTHDLSPIRLLGSAWSWKTFKIFMNVGHVGSLHHRSLFTTYGLFDINYKIAADYEFLLRAKDNLKASFLNSVTVKMRAGGLSHGSLNVFKEAYRAKVVTASRSSIISKGEYFIAVLKFYVRKLISKQ